MNLNISLFFDFWLLFRAKQTNAKFLSLKSEKLTHQCSITMVFAVVSEFTSSGSSSFFSTFFAFFFGNSGSGCSITAVCKFFSSFSSSFFTAFFVFFFFSNSGSDPAGPVLAARFAELRVILAGNSGFAGSCCLSLRFLGAIRETTE
jgi:hypothetical protein